MKKKYLVLIISVVCSISELFAQFQYNTYFENPNDFDSNVWTFYSTASKSNKAYWGFSTVYGLSTSTYEGLWCAGSKTPNADPSNLLAGSSPINIIMYDADMDAIAAFNTSQAFIQSNSTDLIGRATNFKLSFKYFIPALNQGDYCEVFWLDNNNQKHLVTKLESTTIGGWNTTNTLTLAGFTAYNFLYFKFKSNSIGPKELGNGIWISDFNLSASVAPYTAKLFFEAQPDYNVQLSVTPKDINNNPTQSTAGFNRYYYQGTTINLSAPAVNSSTGQYFKYWAVNDVQYSSSANATFTVMSENDKITAQYSKIPITINATTDKTQYNLGEQPILTVNLGNSLSTATVTYSINGGTPVNCQNQGNGIYRATLPASTTATTNTIAVWATASSYEAASTQLEYTVINALAGHDIEIFNFAISNTNIVPGNAIKLDGITKNVGTASWQGTVRFRLYDANNNVINEKNYTHSLNPSESSEDTPSFSTRSSWSGTYTVEMYIINLYDITQENNISRLSVFITDDPPFTQYSLGETGYVIPLNSTSNILGHNVKFVSYGSNYANVQVDGGSTTKCIQNQLTLFSGGNFILLYGGLFNGSDAYFDAGIAPSSYYGVSNYTMVIDAGQTATFYFTSSAAPNSYQDQCYGPDGTTIKGWGPSFKKVGIDNQNFSFNVPVPINSTRKTYEFWPDFYGADEKDHIQILKIQVHEPHNVSTVNLSPSNGSNFSIGNIAEIKAAIKNLGGYDESVVNAQISINGPNGYSYSNIIPLNISIGAVDTLKNNWNTTGLALGTYTIKVSALITNDAYSNDNSLTSSITLVAPPAPDPPTLLSPSDITIDAPTNITCYWNTVNTASSYKIQIAFDDQFVSLVADTTLIINQYTAKNLVKGTRYFWRVSSNNLGGTGMSSSTWQFKTIPNPPGIPTLVSPDINAQRHLVPICFKWEIVAEAQKYSLQIAKDTLFTSLMFGIDTLITNYDTVSILSSGSTYYWRVRGRNSGGQGDWTQYRKFSTALSSVLLASPGNSSNDNLLNLTMRWTTVIGATSYRIQIAFDSLFNDIVRDSSNINTINLPIKSLLPNTKYYWHANASDGMYNSVWSSINTFNTGMPPSLLLENKSLNIGTIKIPEYKDTSIIISNPGADTLKIDVINSTNKCFTIRPTSLTIPPGQSKSDTIRFTADSVGLRSAFILFSGNGLTSPDTLTVSGSAVGSAAFSANKTLVFSDMTKLKLWTDTTIAITNTGTDTLKIDTILSTKSFFTIRPRALVIPPGQSKNDTIRFTADSLGTWNGNILFTSNTIGKYDTLKVTATSPIPVLKALKTAVVYGNSAKNETKTDTVKILNSSVNTLVIDSIYTKTAGFSVNRLNGTVDLDTFKIVISFTPTTVAAYLDTLYLHNNSATTLVKIPLSGNAPAPVLNLSTQYLSFGSVQSNIAKQKGINITNTSISSLTIDSIYTKTKYFPINNNNYPANVKIGDTIKINITFQPDSNRIFLDTLYILNNSITDLIEVPLEGNGTITSVSSTGMDLPKKYELFQNYPNPFNPSTNISFNMPNKSFVTLKIYDLLGREVATIVSEEMSAGSYSKQWKAVGLTSGIYFYQLKADGYIETKKLILLK